MLAETHRILLPFQHYDFGNCVFEQFHRSPRFFSADTLLSEKVNTVLNRVR